jgi:hypothetical protein
MVTDVMLTFASDLVVIASKSVFTGHDSNPRNSRERSRVPQKESTAMSNTVLERLTEAQATVLDGLDQARTPAVGMVERVVSVADRVAPDLSANRTGLVPRMGDVIDNQFAFAIELLKRQRTMTRAMVKAASKGPRAASPRVTRTSAPTRTSSSKRSTN